MTADHMCNPHWLVGGGLLGEVYRFRQSGMIDRQLVGPPRWLSWLQRKDLNG